MKTSIAYTYAVMYVSDSRLCQLLKHFLCQDQNLFKYKNLILCAGLTHTETIIPALVEVFHAFTFSSRDMLLLLCKLYVKMLLSEVRPRHSVFYS